MKKYIIPSITIDPIIFKMNFLAGSDPQAKNQVSNADALSNNSLFDDQENTYPSKDKGVWDE